MSHSREMGVPDVFRCLAGVSLCAVLAVAGCGGGSDSQGSTPPNPPPPTFTVGGTVSGLAAGAQLTLNDNGGDPLTVNANGGFTFATPLPLNGSYAVTIGAQPAGQTCTVSNGAGTQVTANVTSVGISCIIGPQFAYVVNVLNDDVSQYAIGANGILAPMSVPTVDTVYQPTFIAVDPLGRFAYVPNEYSGSISQYTIGASGALTAMSPPTVSTQGGYPYGVTVDPSGHFLYLTYEAGGGQPFQFTIGADGALAASLPPSTPALPATRLVIDRAGRFAYGIGQGNVVAQFTIGSGGVLAAMSPPNVAAGNQPQSIALDPSGRFAYVTNRLDSTVSQYTIGADGSLTAMSTPTVSTGDYPTYVAVDPTGRFVYVTNGGSGGSTISQYTIGVNGALTPMSTPTLATGDGPTFVVCDPSGRFVYVLNTTVNTVSQYAIGVDGALTALSVATVPTGTTPVSMAIISR